MHSRFRFRFVCPSMHLAADETISFRAAGASSVPTPEGLNNDLVKAGDLFEFRLSGEKNEEGVGAEGTLYVTVPGDPEESQLLARLLSEDLAEHLSFFYDGFRLLHGLQVAERLPDTPEEAAAIGDGVFWAKAHLEEVLPPFPFNPECLRLFPYARDLLMPMAQLNAALRAKNPVDGFLSAIKVLEYLYHDKGRSFADSLQTSTELRSAVASVVVTDDASGVPRHLPDDEITQLLKDLVTTRNQCAHLRANGNYGYHLRHPELATVVQPRLGIVVGLARHILQARMETARAARRPSSPPSEDVGA